MKNIKAVVMGCVALVLSLALCAACTVGPDDRPEQDAAATPGVSAAGTTSEASQQKPASSPVCSIPVSTDDDAESAAPTDDGGLPGATNDNSSEPAAPKPAPASNPTAPPSVSTPAPVPTPTPSSLPPAQTPWPTPLSSSAPPVQEPTPAPTPTPAPVSTPTETRTICNICGADITGNVPAHGDSHLLGGEDFSYRVE